jgi:hypothetical protein
MAYGGTGYRNGGAGTVYLKGSAQAYWGFDYYINNNGVDAPADSTLLRSIGSGTSTALAPNMLTDANANFPLPDLATGALGLIGLKPNFDR